MSIGPYDAKFYDRQQERSFRGAACMLPFLISAIRPRSMIDLGCGVGPWLKTALDHGVEDVLGLDGDWVKPDMLVVPPDRFQAANIAEGNWGAPRNFDLAISMEVLEHIPDEAGRIAVDRLRDIAPIVVVSAAIPGQGGRNHINEQWQSYWARIFAEGGYVASDILRRKFLARPEVPYYYSQNALVYGRTETLKSLGFPITPLEELDIVHPELLAKHRRKMKRRDGRGTRILSWLKRFRNRLKSFRTNPTRHPM